MPPTPEASSHSTYDVTLLSLSLELVERRSATDVTSRHATKRTNFLIDRLIEFRRPLSKPRLTEQTLILTDFYRIEWKLDFIAESGLI